MELVLSRLNGITISRSSPGIIYNCPLILNNNEILSSYINIKKYINIR